MFKYFSEKVTRGFISIYSTRIILRISSNLMGLFIPIFLYIFFEFSLEFVFLYYLAGYLLYALTVAWGAQYLNKVGLRRSLRFSILLGAFYYFIFFLMDGTTIHDGSVFLFPHKASFLVAFSILILTLNRILYWVPMHTDIAKFTSRGDRGKQISLIEATTLGLGAIMPLVAGWLLANHGYNFLFLIAILIYFLALVPLISIPKTREKFSWTYFQSWKEFFLKKRRRVVLAYLGNGAEDAVGIIIWPIFIWELLQGNYFEVGALSSLIVAVTIILQLSVGRLADKFDKRKMIRWGNVFYASGWIAKIFIATAFQIFVASAYHNMTKIFSRTPFDVLTYEKAADQGHYVDEFTVIHEMSFQLGKILMLVFAFGVVQVFNLQWTFILAALASLAMNYLVQDENVVRGRYAG
ncbi:MAG: hypothetical protein U9R06_02000 [Patescibacteria group bacterium]|nr:hypothetical protein [Patescibacteria group bacterium]